MPPKDHRQIVGSKISTKALYVLHAKECERRFGSSKDRKRFVGTVIGVEVQQITRSGRASTFIDGEYDLEDGNTRRKSILICNVQAETEQDNPQVSNPEQGQAKKKRAGQNSRTKTIWKE